jgi:hypothetical protein
LIRTRSAESIAAFDENPAGTVNAAFCVRVEQL